MSNYHLSKISDISFHLFEMDSISISAKVISKLELLMNNEHLDQINIQKSILYLLKYILQQTLQIHDNIAIIKNEMDQKNKQNNQTY